MPGQVLLWTLVFKVARVPQAIQLRMKRQTRSGTDFLMGFVRVGCNIVLGFSWSAYTKEVAPTLAPPTPTMLRLVTAVTAALTLLTASAEWNPPPPWGEEVGAATTLNTPSVPVPTCADRPNGECPNIVFLIDESTDGRTYRDGFAPALSIPNVRNLLNRRSTVQVREGNNTTSVPPFFPPDTVTPYLHTPYYTLPGAIHHIFHKHARQTAITTRTSHLNTYTIPPTTSTTPQPHPSPATTVRTTCSSTRTTATRPSAARAGPVCGRVGSRTACRTSRRKTRSSR